MIDHDGGTGRPKLSNENRDERYLSVPECVPVVPFIKNHTTPLHTSSFQSICPSCKLFIPFKTLEVHSRLTNATWASNPWLCRDLAQDTTSRIAISSSKYTAHKSCQGHSAVCNLHGKRYQACHAWETVVLGAIKLHTDHQRRMLKRSGRKLVLSCRLSTRLS